ncbi:MAG: aldehyde ferredoxin oxidoreductase N-terminal domain-containing protein [Dehalococcoidia bacterium]|nr:aldehyde ferredoxin oxidoreductase N-terminal domain-containing protein [Dehalococcoidia bacterium]
MKQEFGYAGSILRVDLSSGKITAVPTTDYAERFLGGRGIAARVYWDEVMPEVKALDSDNRLIFITGPLAGVSPGVGGVRWLVCGKSPVTSPEQFSYSNLGGSWGTELKYAGFDGVIVHGKSETPVYLSIVDGAAELRDASTLWGKSNVETRELLKTQLGKHTRVVTTGPAGEHMVSLATILADNDASGSGGFGAVMGSKKLKAIAVRGTGKILTANPEKLAELNRHVRRLRRTSPGGSIWGERATPEKKRLDICRACSLGCERLVYESKDGREGKFICGQVGFYQARAQRYYGEKDWREVPFQAAMLANDYGVDVFSLGPIMMWLSRCNRAGILTDENTGIPLSRMGSLDFVESLVRKISLREGFGDVLAGGILKAAVQVGDGSEKLITDYVTKGEQGVAYDPRYYITTGLLYAMEPRQPIQQLHEVSRPLLNWLAWAYKSPNAYVSTGVFRAIARRFWGTELAADLSTYEGKALTAARIQDREYAKESMILCDWVWPILSVESSEDHVGDPALESKVLSAAIGKEINEEGLYGFGERIVNLQRAIVVREARGSDTIPEFHFSVPLRDDPMNPQGIAPGRDGEIIGKKGAVLDRTKFEEMKKEFYHLRGWDKESGLQTKEKLDELDLKDVAAGLRERKLLV